MMRRRPLRKFCPRCKRLIPPGMVPRAHSVCMPDDWSVCGGIVETTVQKLRRILWGTEPTTRWLWFILGFALAGLLLAGCATTQTYQTQQATYQAKADQWTCAGFVDTWVRLPVLRVCAAARTLGETAWSVKGLAHVVENIDLIGRVPGAKASTASSSSSAGRVNQDLRDV